MAKCIIISLNTRDMDHDSVDVGSTYLHLFHASFSHGSHRLDDSLLIFHG